MFLQTAFALANILAPTVALAVRSSPSNLLVRDASDACHGLTSYTTGGKEFQLTPGVVKSTTNYDGPLWDLTLEGCIAACAAADPCTDLSYTSGGTCYLKQGVIVPSKEFTEDGTCDALLVGPASTPTTTSASVDSTCAASTVTIPASTITEPASTITLPGDVVTIPASTLTLPASVITEPASTITLPASVITEPASTITLPASVVTQPASTSTLTVTASLSSSAACSQSTDAIVNGGFESALPPWLPITAGDGNYERTSSGAATGSWSYRSRISATTGNLPASLVQAVSLCPGTTYRLSISARRVTSAGTVSLTVYVGVGAAASVAVIPTTVIAATSFNTLTGSDITVPTGAGNTYGIVNIVVSYTGATGSVKELQIDDVKLTPV